MPREEPRRSGVEDTRLRTAAREREPRNQCLGRDSGRRYEVPVLNSGARTTANSDKSDRRTTTGVQGSHLRRHFWRKTIFTSIFFQYDEEQLKKPEQFMSWIWLRRLGYSQIPEVLWIFSWSLCARNLNPSRRHYVICSTAIGSRYFRQTNTIMETTGIIASYARHDTLVWTYIIINTTNIIISEFVWITIGYRCFSALIYAMTCSDNDLWRGKFGTCYLCLQPFQSSEIAMLELRKRTCTYAITNHLNAYKRNMFIRVLLPTIIIIVHVVID